MQIEDVLAALADVGGWEIQSAFGIVGCILATRIALEVLRHWNVRARPLSVRATITPERGGPGTDVCSVMLGHPSTPRPGFWQGHLVALCDESYLVDLSIQQANLPQLDFELVPFYRRVSREFVAGLEALELTLGNAALKYDALPPDASYRAFQDWKGRSGPRQQQAVQAINRRMRLRAARSAGQGARAG